MDHANQRTSQNLEDGLELKGAYVTAAVKCAPPDNKPSTEETTNCSAYLASEIDSLRDLKTIFCLEQFALNAVIRTIRNKYNPPPLTAKFGHGRALRLGEGIPVVICSY